MSKQKHKSYFVTGTDTGAGKTWSAVALMQALQKQGYLTCGMKPIASGGLLEERALVSEDAKLLMQWASMPLPYKLVNPICFKSPTSPNIAAVLEKKPVDTGKILQAYEDILCLVDRLVIEGIGGWRTPCLNSAGMSALVREMKLPVILVVGLRLGCINHALLTKESILADGLELVGWIANAVDPNYNYANETVEFLQSCLGAPLLGRIPHQTQPYLTGLGGFICVPE